MANCVKVLQIKEHPYKLPVGKLEHCHSNKLPRVKQEVGPNANKPILKTPEIIFLFVGPYNKTKERGVTSPAWWPFSFRK